MTAARVSQPTERAIGSEREGVGTASCVHRAVDSARAHMAGRARARTLLFHQSEPDVRVHQWSAGVHGQSSVILAPTVTTAPPPPRTRDHATSSRIAPSDSPPRHSVFRSASRVRRKPCLSHSLSLSLALSLTHSLSPSPARALTSPLAGRTIVRT